MKVPRSPQAPLHSSINRRKRTGSAILMLAALCRPYRSPVSSVYRCVAGNAPIRIKRPLLQGSGHRSERTMPLRHLELDASGAADVRAAHLGHAVLETFRHDYLDAV